MRGERGPIIVLVMLTMLAAAPPVFAAAWPRSVPETDGPSDLLNVAVDEQMRHLDIRALEELLEGLDDDVRARLAVDEFARYHRRPGRRPPPQPAGAGAGDGTLLAGGGAGPVTAAGAADPLGRVVRLFSQLGRVAVESGHGFRFPRRVHGHHLRGTAKFFHRRRHRPRHADGHEHVHAGAAAFVVHHAGRGRRDLQRRLVSPAAGHRGHAGSQLDRTSGVPALVFRSRTGGGGPDRGRLPRITHRRLVSARRHDGAGVVLYIVSRRDGHSRRRSRRWPTAWSCERPSFWRAPSSPSSAA